MDILCDGLHKARKPHVCTWCGEVIKKGEKYRKSVFVDAGNFYPLKLHPECSFAMDRSYRFYGCDFEYYEHENPRGLTDYEWDEILKGGV
jgi:hypothetical protein